MTHQSIESLDVMMRLQMRTTVTLDPDTRLLIERVIKERGLTFKQAVNDAIRRGLGGSGRGFEGPFTSPRDLGSAHVDLTKALSLAGDLEDDAIARRLSEGR